MTPIESASLWPIHAAAQAKAKAAGACWQCAREMGCRATDRWGEPRRRFEIHPGCARKLEVATKL